MLNYFQRNSKIWVHKNWLREVTPSEGACVGGYAYIPGTHVSPVESTGGGFTEFISGVIRGNFCAGLPPPLG